jgi:uncharacterized membrane protein (UPF0136 family)
MGRDDPSGRFRLRLCAAALAWSLALIPAALWAPVYHGGGSTTSVIRGVSTATTFSRSATLTDVNGDWVLILVAVPALLALAVTGALALRRRPVAKVVVIVLAAFNILAMFSIGIFILPASVLLVCAVFVAPGPARHQPAAI